MLTQAENDFLQNLFDVAQEADTQKGRDCYNDWCKNFLFGSSPQYPESNYDRFLQYGEDLNISSKQWDMYHKIAGYLGITR